MKTLVISAIIATATATASFAEAPNNYIGTDNNGVISERVGNDANNIVTRDMATQVELNAVSGKSQQDAAFFWERTEDNKNEIYRVDQEDHRVVDASVNDDGNLVLHSQDMDGGTKREKVTGVNIAAGKDGTDGSTGAKGEIGLDGVSGISMLSALYATGGNGFGIGIAVGSVKEISFVVAFETGRNTNLNLSVTHDSHGRTVGTAAIGFGF